QARIAADGLLIGEFPPGEPPLGHNFPRRNRLIAALARGVVVVEAGARSGALITVEHAMDLGREIFAVPGPIDRETSVGANALLRDGAGLVTGAADVLEELGLAGPDAVARARAEAASRDGGAESVPDGWDERARRLWSALDRDPLHVDVLAHRCRLSPATALSTLLELELGGYARQLPGTRFSRAR
ncbi:MAG: DNA-processing protein DprA, partial [Gemmatimonadota bacterium]